MTTRLSQTPRMAFSPVDLSLVHGSVEQGLPDLGEVGLAVDHRSIGSGPLPLNDNNSMIMKMPPRTTMIIVAHCLRMAGKGAFCRMYQMMDRAITTT